MLAKDIMRRKVISVRPEMTIREVAKLFTDRRITGAPVMEDGKLIGVVSQTDVVRRDRAASRSKVPDFYRHGEAEILDRLDLIGEIPQFDHVIDVMTPAILSADENTPVEELARCLLKRRIHRLMITRRGRLCGIVTSMDLLKALLSRRSSKKR